MAGKGSTAAKPFQGIRIEVDTLVPFGEVLSRLRGLMGDASVPELVALAKEATTQTAYVQKVEQRFVGESGFVLFHEIDHGGGRPPSPVHPHTPRRRLVPPPSALPQ